MRCDNCGEYMDPMDYGLDDIHCYNCQGEDEVWGDVFPDEKLLKEIHESYDDE